MEKSCGNSGRSSADCPCFAMLGIADRRRVIAIGDSLRTDIAGANAAGIDSVLVTGTGLKDIAAASERVRIPGAVPPDLVAVQHLLGETGN